MAGLQLPEPTWTPEALAAALSDVFEGRLSLADAARTWGIPAGTMRSSHFREKKRREKAQQKAAAKAAPAPAPAPPPAKKAREPKEKRPTTRGMELGRVDGLPVRRARRGQQFAEQAPATPPLGSAPATSVWDLGQSLFADGRDGGVLTHPQWKAVFALVEGRSLADAAKVADVTADTVSRWRRDVPEFMQMVESVQAELHAATLDGLRRGAQEFSLGGRIALRKLMTTLHRPDLMPAEQAAVARTIFQGLSMYLGHGGYPKVEQVEHTAEVTGASPILLGELGAEATADLAQRLYQEMTRPPDAAREA